MVTRSSSADDQRIVSQLTSSRGRRKPSAPIHRMLAEHVTYRGFAEVSHTSAHVCERVVAVQSNTVGTHVTSHVPYTARDCSLGISKDNESLVIKYTDVSTQSSGHQMISLTSLTSCYPSTRDPTRLFVARSSQDGERTFVHVFDAKDHLTVCTYFVACSKVGVFLICIHVHACLYRRLALQSFWTASYRISSGTYKTFRNTFLAFYTVHLQIYTSRPRSLSFPFFISLYLSLSAMYHFQISSIYPCVLTHPCPQGTASRTALIFSKPALTFYLHTYRPSCVLSFWKLRRTKRAKQGSHRRLPSSVTSLHTCLLACSRYCACMHDCDLSLHLCLSLRC